MFGCTIVVRRKRRRINSRNRFNKNDSGTRKRQRTRRKTKRKGVSWKKLILPLILIISLGIFAISMPSETQKKISVKKNDSTSSNVINYVQANADVGDFSEYYFAVVTNDFCSYDERTSLDDRDAVILGIWSVVCSDEGTEEYDCFDEKMYIPQEKIEECVKKLFGKKTIKHQKIKTKNFTFDYDRESGSYIVPITGFAPVYSPSLESVETKSGETILTVGCLKNKNFVQDSKGNTVKPKPTKYLEITLKKHGKELYISKIKEQA